MLAGVQRDLKLHDVDEVPIYTASDVNKLLTVMSDGSLRWLGISESYVVEVIRDGGDPAEEPQIAGTFIEDLEGFTGTAVDGIWTDSGSQQGQYASIGLSTDNVIGYVGGEPTEDEFTISWWMNLPMMTMAIYI